MPTRSADDSGAGFVRTLSTLDSVMLVAGSMIGSGIFLVPAGIVREVGSPGLLLVVWAVTALVVVFGALSYGELAGMYPRTGGLYIYLREGISPLFGFLYGWTLFTVIQTGSIAAVAVSFATFLSVLVPSLTPHVFLGGTVHLPSGTIEVGLSGQRVVAVSSVLLLTWINVRGVRTAAALQTSLTLLKTALLAGLIVVGLTVGRHADAVAANFGGAFWPADGFRWALIPVLGAAMTGSIAASDLWYQVGFAAGEVKRPERDIPLAMLLGTLLVTSLYFLANIAYLQILPASAIATAAQDRVGSVAMQAVFGETGLLVMSGAIVLSCFGCSNAIILSGARVYWAMARDGLFFRAAARLHPTYRTPHVALWAQAAWACALCLAGTYSQLLEYMVFASLLFYMLTIVGLFALRRRRPDAPRPVRAVGYPVLPAIYFVATAGLCVILLVRKPQFTWPGLVLVACGIPLYALWRSRTPAHDIAALDPATGEPAA